VMCWSKSAKFHLTADDDDRESDSDGNADEHDLDAETGDLGSEECDKLDEQMWADDDEEPIKVSAFNNRAAAKARNWLGTTPHGRTNCNHIFIEGTYVEPQKTMVVKFAWYSGLRQLAAVLLCLCKKDKMVVAAILDCNFVTLDFLRNPLADLKLPFKFCVD